jgi:hypothetical protein
MKLDWSEEKNQLLKKQRSLCFEMVEQALLSGNLIDIQHNPSSKHPEQLIMYIKIDDYVYCVPFVENGDTFFLKTIFPSRKMNKLYQKGEL